MNYDRFDVLAAYYHFILFTVSIRYLEGEKRRKFIEYQGKIERQIRRLKYKPGLSDSSLWKISPNAKSIYMSLVHKYLD